MRIFDLDAPGGDFESCLAVQDAASGLRALLVVHSTARGPAYGGIRRWRYEHESHALDDARRLAAAMSAKCALAGLAAGGAKTVILDHPELDAPRAYEALGRFIDALGGRYVCGPDVGTSDAELAALRRVTRYVNPPGNDAGRSTAAGVLAALTGLLHVQRGTGSVRDSEAPSAANAIEPSMATTPWAGKRFAVHGLGAVGTRVAAGLVERGGEVVVYDPDPGARARGAALGLAFVDDEATLLAAPCDVLVPCAMGGVLTRERVASLRASAVCGSANNVVATPDVAEALFERGIVLVPDVLTSAGAVIEGVLTTQEGWGTAVSDEARAAVERAIEAITPRVVDVLVEAHTLGVSPTEVVRRRVAGALVRRELAATVATSERRRP